MALEKEWRIPERLLPLLCAEMDLGPEDGAVRGDGDMAGGAGWAIDGWSKVGVTLYLSSTLDDSGSSDIAET